MKFWFLHICFLSVSSLAIAQPLTEEAAVALALRTYPLVHIAEKQLQLQQALEKSAFNPSQPQLTFEFPNDIGLAFEFQQTFDFPGVYTARSKWLKSQTKQQEAAVTITRRELQRDVRLAYLDVQAAQALEDVLSTQDSVWRDLDLSTQRLYAGGHINKADALFASKQAGLVHAQHIQAQLDAQTTRIALAAWIDTLIADVEVLHRSPMANMDTAGGYYFEQYVNAQREVAERELAVSKNERLPGIIAGYLRVPEVDTDYRTRFNAGITIPIWQGQYRSAVTAARLTIESLESETELRRIQAQVMAQQLIETITQTREILDSYERTVLPQTNELVSAYQRLYEGGEADYTLTLWNIADALDAHLQYLETLKQHNQAEINLDFLHQN